MPNLCNVITVFQTKKITSCYLACYIWILQATCKEIGFSHLAIISAHNKSVINGKQRVKNKLFKSQFSIAVPVGNRARCSNLFYRYPTLWYLCESKVWLLNSKWLETSVPICVYLKCCGVWLNTDKLSNLRSKIYWW